MEKTQAVMLRMMDDYAGDPKRIQHFIKVYQFAKLIAAMENVDQSTREIIEVAALTHDIGIKASEEKYGSSAGKYQEREGPPIAREMLLKIGYALDFTARVCFLIAHHHTYDDIRAIDHQILVEADFLVNAYEDHFTAQAVESVLGKVFKTASGKALLQTMYGLGPQQPAAQKFES